MQPPQRSFLIPIVLLAFLAAPAVAELRLPNIFGDHMVIQQKQRIHVWGWADPGEKVTVVLGKRKATKRVDKDGRFSVKLWSLEAGGPYTLVVETSSGDRKAFEDVLIGEVWVCSGQSNMEWSVKHGIDDGEKHAAEANHAQIRFFDIPHTTAETPRDDVDAKWAVCTPETMSTFSAAGYFFGRELHQKLGVPIGLIGSNWGGTEAEPWTSPEGLKREKRLRPHLEMWEQKIASDQKLATSHTRPAAIYNAMIAPVTPFPVAGVIWYQGESNVPRADQYHFVFPALIDSWRRAWDRKLPFYFVQIAPWQYKARWAGHTEYALPLLWDAQLHTLKTVDDTGMVVVHDVGNIEDIHPRDKLTVGLRLANWALEDTYDLDGIPVSGPIFDGDFDVDNGKVQIEFYHEGAGLVTKDGKEPSHFLIAGEDRVFQPAQTRIISDDTVLVWSEDVLHPKAVRFAWHETAEPNLFNRDGLPASPFRTDNWPVEYKVK